MNYRHAFHAGNFADLLKHAAVTLLMDRLTSAGHPVLVLDSHAGAGIYALDGAMALKSGEARAGILRLMADEGAPEVFGPLKAAVAGANRPGTIRVYPGSPVLIAGRLRRDDRYVGAELRPDDFDSLSEALSDWRGRASAVAADGYALLRDRAADGRRLFVLIDPPFERPDDYDQILAAAALLLNRPHPATVLIWLPLKDLETFDSVLRGLELLEPPSVLVAEARLNALHDPMRMNGCALLVLNPPPGLETPLATAAEWVVASAGEPTGRAKVWRLTHGA